MLGIFIMAILTIILGCLALLGITISFISENLIPIFLVILTIYILFQMARKFNIAKETVCSILQFCILAVYLYIIFGHYLLFGTDILFYNGSALKYLGTLSGLPLSIGIIGRVRDEFDEDYLGFFLILIMVVVYAIVVLLRMGETTFSDYIGAILALLLGNGFLVAPGLALTGVMH